MLSVSAIMSGVAERSSRPSTPNHRPTIGGRAAMADAHSSPTLKLCRKCQRLLPLSYFSMKAGRPSVYQSPCRRCRHDQEHRLLRTKPVTQAWRDRARGYVRTYKDNHKEKIRAHHKVFRAVKSGKLVRPSHCQQCGNTHSRIEAHHADYSRALDVTWLCRPCHDKTKRLYD